MYQLHARKRNSISALSLDYFEPFAKVPTQGKQHQVQFCLSLGISHAKLRKANMARVTSQRAHLTTPQVF
jgi:hypothetical protein